MDIINSREKSIILTNKSERNKKELVRILSKR